MQRRRELMMAGGGLPGVYRRVEYLESYNKAYIDTLLNGTGDLCTLIDFGIVDATYIFGTTTAQNKNYYGLNCRKTNKDYELYYASISNNSFPTTGSWDYGERHLLLIENGKFILDNVPLYDFGLQTFNSNSIYLFGLNYNKGSFHQNRIYSCKFYRSDETIMNLVPCIRKSDSEPGMYDTVSKTFYTNAGTGEFVIPPP